jgi:hypothetical protein
MIWMIGLILAALSNKRSGTAVSCAALVLPSRERPGARSTVISGNVPVLKWTVILETGHSALLRRMALLCRCIVDISAKRSL